MKGLNYTSKLTYTYSKKFEEMQRILEKDGFDNFKLNDNLKIVEYSIDNSKTIQLSLLLYLQEIQLIRFTIAQQIQLCQIIYLKYNYLQKYNIQHNYLSSDRIWLKVTNNHQITILPQFLQYSIHFVGFDCPFYEIDNYQNSKREDGQTIKDIITKILHQLKIKELKKSKSPEKTKALQIIFTSLLEQGICKSFDNFFEESSKIFKRYNYKNQRLSGLIDKELTIYKSKRARRIDDVIGNIKLIISSYYKEGQSFKFQQILYTIFPIIAKELKNATFYQNQLLPKNQNQIYLELDKQIFSINKQEVDQIINENKESIMKDFKFDIDLQQIKEIINSELPNQLKFLNYFLNNAKFADQHINNILSFINQFKKEIIQKVIISTLKDYLNLQILKLIQELI
ncbi:unnamed protein product [Paramecium primaurelia]|uniref:Uncharacterized protein n=1 Tax=Paramecium primaurelia TaxID=5886 RepID=A0A8S1PGX9_PARPR|nr:unnamed protein product [Paramecium primaurelia]